MTVSAKDINFKIQGDHSELDAVIQLPAGLDESKSKVPMVIMCHGFTGDKEGNLTNFIADSLLAKGFAVLRFDFNGHGKSGGCFQDMTVPNEIEDAKKVIEYAQALPYVKKLILCGHSQGGVVSAMTAAMLGRKRISAIVLLAPAGILRDNALRGDFVGAKFDPKNPPETIPIFNNLILGGEYIRTVQSLPIYETAQSYKGQELIIHGDDDRTVPYTYGQRFHYLNPKSEFVLLDGADHCFVGRDAEVAHYVVEFLAPKFGKVSK